MLVFSGRAIVIPSSVDALIECMSYFMEYEDVSLYAKLLRKIYNSIVECNGIIDCQELYFRLLADSVVPYSIDLNSVRNGLRLPHSAISDLEQKYEDSYYTQICVGRRANNFVLLAEETRVFVAQEVNCIVQRMIQHHIMTRNGWNND